MRIFISLFASRRVVVSCLAVLFAASGEVSAQAPVGSEFTYQGQIKLLGNPLNDTADFAFTLWDTDAGDSQVGATVLVNNVAVVNGLFAVELDFGVIAFSGDARWLEIDIRSPAGGGAFATLDPRQALTAAPYALYALNGGGGPWSESGGNVYFDGGNVGIGETNPTTKLHIVSPVEEEHVVLIDSTGNDATALRITATGDSSFGIYASTTDTAISGSSLFEGGAFSASSAGGRGVFGTSNAATGTGRGVWGRTNSPDGYAGYFTGGRNYFQGNVGIGEANPTVKLHIVGPPAEGVVVQIDTNGEDVTALKINATAYPSVGIEISAMDTAILGSAPIEGGRFFGSGAGGTGVSGIANAATGNGKGVYGSANSPSGHAGYFVGRGYFSGNVGIGETNPTAKLHIGGTPGTDGIKFPDGSLQTTAVSAGGGDGHSLDASDGDPIDALFLDNNGDVTVLTDLTVGGEITLKDSSSGTDLASLNRNDDGHGRLVTFADGSGVASAVVGTDTDANGAGGLVLLSFDDALGPAVKLDSTGNAGRATLARSTAPFAIDETVVMYADAPRTDNPAFFTRGGGIDLLNGNGVRTIALRGDDGFSGESGLIMGFDGNGTMVFELDTEISSGAPNMTLEHPSGGNASRLFFTVDSGGRIEFRNAAGATTISIDSDDGNGSDGNSVITTQILAITGGSDLSENFDIRALDGEVVPGMVVCIDPDRPGKLVVSRRAYDRTVAGVISGAGGVVPGMRMGQVGSVADGDHPVALTGRVYVFADASGGPIQPGDLMTTSGVPGHAMKVTRHDQVTGTILGKAMTSLDSGRGLVLILIALQ